MSEKSLEKGKETVDVVNQFTGEKWYYTDIVKDHFFNPRNLQLEDLDSGKFDAFGMVGSPACGDMMSMGLRVESQIERVREMKWKTFGCASAIAATSMFSVMVTENGGMLLADALKIKPQDIMARLGGLPNRKIHCSVLADKAFRKAANDYFRKTGQFGKIVVEGAKVIDAKLNITDKDIEEAVLEGAMDIESVQKKLKVGVGSPEIIPEVEQLIRFYKEKYYG
ncbi:MAG: iron-sulfur cluster assembly scaffold protein [bacterium]|nr:iron-sulfur cluster assembly scaffold protein [bacterium]